MGNQNAPKYGQVNYSSNNIVLIFILIKNSNNNKKSGTWSWSCFPCYEAGLDLRSVN